MKQLIYFLGELVYNIFGILFVLILALVFALVISGDFNFGKLFWDVLEVIR